MWFGLGLGALFAPGLYVAGCYVCGRQVRSGEAKFIKAWLAAGVPEKHLRLPHVYVPESSAATPHVSAVWSRGVDLAKRYENGGDTLIVANADWIGATPFDSWFLTRRLRRMVDRTARRQKIPVLPIPFRAWPRAYSSPATFWLVQRRGRECVFAKATGDGEPTYYLSGFDSNERPSLYFLTQLPRPVSSIKDAREALKPRTVVMAEQAGRRVLRQGDMFAIPVALTDDDLLGDGAVISDIERVRRGYYRGTKLYGTAHTADRVAVLPDGTMFAWGRMRHNPRLIEEFRPPDHKPLRLRRNRWHLVVKNATPMRQPDPAPVPSSPRILSSPPQIQRDRPLIMSAYPSYQYSSMGVSDYWAITDEMDRLQRAIVPRPMPEWDGWLK